MQRLPLSRLLASCAPVQGRQQPGVGHGRSRQGKVSPMFHGRCDQLPSAPSSISQETVIPRRSCQKGVSNIMGFTRDPFDQGGGVLHYFLSHPHESRIF